MKTGGDEDPLSNFLEEGKQLDDPLRRMAVEEDSIKGPSSSVVTSSSKGMRDTFEPWGVRKAGILSRFTTHEKLSLTTSSFTSGDGKSIF